MDTATTSNELNPVAVVSENLQQILIHMGIQADLQVRLEPADEENRAETVYIDLNGENSQLAELIGRKGETLQALQQIVRLLSTQVLQSPLNVELDVDGYKQRRDAQLRRLAVRMAQRATQTRRTVSLDPMPATERRVIHLALADFEGVTTHSVGDGAFRKVTIVPKR
ncbi:MAG TPA: R3H domain-containing nucleic acid-binding protein [Anaerolineales bacterium]|nr:R3H domain-containing nucleic acid-binding protein [Anaerolineales bacterium]